MSEGRNKKRERGGSLISYANTLSSYPDFTRFHLFQENVTRKG
jgi:hypothetical protein